MAYIDFRYPNINLNQTPRLPNNFGPPNMANMFQSGISALADPIVSRLKELEEQYRADETKKDILGAYRAGGLTTPVTPASTTTGSPAGDDTAGTMGGGASARASPEVRDSFMNTVRNAPDGVKNPYGLAAVAATTESESGWSSGNVNRVWNDKGAPSGGLMSWRAGRLKNMLDATRGAEDPVTAQAQFFIKENPQLIADLNAARSPEEANALMANAWRYEGYKGGPQFAQREALTKRYAAQLGDAAPAPAPAPTASFAPTVAPAPTPEAAATVTAPQGPQTAPQSPQQPPPQAPQAAAAGAQGQQQDPVQAAQQQVIAAADLQDQANAARLAETRQDGRTRVASLDPSVRISPTAPRPDLGTGAPTDTAAVPPITPPPAVTRPAPSPAPAEPAVGTGVPPSEVPTAVPPPIRVAEARPSPAPQRAVAPVDPVAERMLLGMLGRARTQAEVLQIGQELLKLRQGQKPSVHSTPEGLYEYDPNTRTAKPLGTAGKAANTVEVEVGGEKRRFQWSPERQRYDIPVGPATSAPGTVPPSKEIREAERALFNDFEGNETVKKYRELEQGVQGLKGAFQGGSGTADLVAVIQLFKTIDPGSTVTGGENATFKNAAGVPETLRALFNKGVGAGGQFSPELRAEIFNTARALQVGKLQQAEQIAKTFRNRAKAYHLDPDRTIGFEPFKFETAKPEDFPDRKREGAGTGTPRRGSRENPIVMPDEESAKKMPVGTIVRIPGKRKLWGPNEPDRTFEVLE